MKAVELVKVMGDEADQEHYVQHAELTKLRQENELLRKILNIKDEVKNLEEKEEELKREEIIPELFNTGRRNSK
jgi:flagellar motility protein MotE (MotC chaperone)